MTITINHETQSNQRLLLSGLCWLLYVQYQVNLVPDRQTDRQTNRPFIYLSKTDRLHIGTLLFKQIY